MFLACSSASRTSSEGDSTARDSNPSPHASVLETEDGLRLSFDKRERRFASFDVSDALSASMTKTAGLGVSLSDHRGVPLLDINAIEVSAVAREGDTLRITRTAPSTGLQTIESWTAHPRHIDVRVDIVSNENRSRAIEACLLVPIDLTGKRWHHHLHESEVIADEVTYQTLLTSGLDIGHESRTGFGAHLKSALPFNLHGVNAVGDERAGLALAMHPETPGSYYVAYDATDNRLRACFHLSVYTQHRTRPDRTHFRLVLMNVDRPAWGLRSAVSEYTSIFSDWFRVRSPERTGMTVGAGYNYRRYPAPTDYHISNMWNALNKVNPTRGVRNLLYVWPTGYLDRGVRLQARLVDGPCAECDRSIDTHITACMNLYRDYEAGLVRFPQTCSDTWSQTGCRASAVPPTEQRRYGPVRIKSYFYDLIPTQVTIRSDYALRLFGQFPVHDLFDKSILRGPDDRYEGAISDSHALMRVGADLYTCYINGLNPDPGVLVSTNAARASLKPDSQADAPPPPVEFDNFGQLNIEIAKRALGVYGEAHLFKGRSDLQIAYDGVALDTVGAYVRPDFHPPMLEVASYPLAYDPDTGKPVAMEHLGLTAFLRAIRAQLPRSAEIATNGYPVSGTLGQGVDHFIRELGRRLRRTSAGDKPKHINELYDEPESIRARRIHRARMVAGQRPITFWARFIRTRQHADERGVSVDQALHQDLRRLLPLYTATGVYLFVQKTGIPGRDGFFRDTQDPSVTSEYKRHLDTVFALTRAGWQPVPYARASDPQVWIERFGSPGATQLFTLYNPTPDDIRSTVHIDWAAITGRQSSIHVRDMYTAARIAASREPDGYRTDALTIPAYATVVLSAAGDR